MPQRIIIVRHSGLRPVPIEEVLPALPAGLASAHRADIAIDTQLLASQIEQGDWEGQAAALAADAARVHSAFGGLPDAEVHFFGFAEIPHLIAMGAFIGDEIPVVIHDWDRDARSWTWPSDAGTVRVTTKGLPTGDPVPAEGSAVLRIELSFAISDADVHEAVGANHLAQVRVTHADESPPEICRVRSAADLQTVREEIRGALAALRAKFPNLDTIHVFAAAPLSVCVALGQELKPRNSPPILTYRYRRVDGRPAYAPALVLSAQAGQRAQAPLTPGDLQAAAEVRIHWKAALADVETYAARKRAQFNGRSVPWYEMLEPSAALTSVRPFPPLLPVTAAVPTGAQVAAGSVESEYGFKKVDPTWHLSDRLLIGFHRAVAGDPGALRRLIRLFLLHEYLHDHHSLSKYRAGGVGAFPNCLEHIDYTADTYALLHQLDLQRLAEPAGVESDDQQRKFLGAQIELVLRSFWAFEPAAPVLEWQVRRLRRYLNWYWRFVQVQYAPDILSVVRLFSRAPHVEIAGLHQYARDRRLFCRVDRFDSTTGLELALVLENCKLLRVPDSTTLNLEQLMRAFQDREHDAIVRYFYGVFELAADMGGALPAC
ncbi:MAG: hypothetical protein AMXMBFR58_15970 [Phycisphaerae bacterium]